MADPNEDKIDFSKLEKELSAAVESDAHYWRENDAKMRAVEQRVETYEQFKDMVAASHIKPLEKNDKNGILSGTGCNGRNQPWNPYSSKGDKKAVTGTGNQLQNKDASALPKNSNDLTKQWRKLKENSAKYTFLISIGGDHLAKIFHAEISYGLLGEIITALNSCQDSSDLCEVTHILTCLTKANRFDLSLDFLSKKEKTHCSELVNKLESYLANDAVDSVDSAVDGTDSEATSEGTVDVDGKESEGAVHVTGREGKPNVNSSHLEMHGEDSEERLMVTKEVVEHIKKVYKVIPLGK